MDDRGQGIVERIEQLKSLTQEYAAQEPLAWAAPMRLFGEKIADLVGKAHGLNSDKFEDRKEYLEHLISIDAIGREEFDNLNNIRWVCNQILHDTEATPAEASQKAWTSFEALASSGLWKRYDNYSMTDPSAEELAEAVVELLGLSAKGVGKLFGVLKGEKGQFFKTRVLPAGGLALTGMALYQFLNSIELPEENEGNRKLDEEG